MHKSEAEHFKMLDAKRKATKVAAQKAINIIRSQGKKRTTPTTSRQVPPDVAFDSRGKPYPVAEKLEYIRAFLLERARWKKEFEKHDIAIPRAKHPEIELTSTKRQRRKGEFTTRGARPDPEGRQADAEAQKAFGRKHPKTGEIEKEEPEVHQTGSSGSEGEERERRTNVRRLGRWKRGSWMGAAIGSANQMNKAARRARTREMDPRRGLRAVARAATRKGLRKRSKSGWETKPRPPEGEVGFRGPADRRV